MVLGKVKGKWPSPKTEFQFPWNDNILHHFEYLIFLLPALSVDRGAQDAVSGPCV